MEQRLHDVSDGGVDGRTRIVVEIDLLCGHVASRGFHFTYVLWSKNKNLVRIQCGCSEFIHRAAAGAIHERFIVETACVHAGPA